MFFGGNDSSDGEIDDDAPGLVDSSGDEFAPQRARPQPKRPRLDQSGASSSARSSAGAAAALADAAALAEAAASDAAGQDFRTYLLAEWKAGRATAKTTCTTAYFATCAGAIGVADFAVAPTDHNSNHARTLRRASNMDAATHCYHTRIPMWDSTTSTKIEPCIPFRVPFAAFADDFAKHPTRYRPLDDEDAADWREMFSKHDVCKRYGAHTCFPVGFYADEVPYQTSQGPGGIMMLINSSCGFP